MPEQYRDEYLSHPSVTPSIDPVVRIGKDDGTGLLKLIKGDANSPLMIPFLYRDGNMGHADVPPAYFQVCGIDPLRDEALIYDRVLREEHGIKTKVDIYPGLCHYFWTNFPRLEASKTFVEDTVKGVGWLLGQISGST